MTFSVLRERKKPVRKGNASTHTFLSRKKKSERGKVNFLFFLFFCPDSRPTFSNAESQPTLHPLPPTPSENFYYVLLWLSLLYTPTLAYVLRKGGLEELDRASQRKRSGKGGRVSFFYLPGPAGEGERKRGRVGEIANKERGWEEFAKYFPVLFSALGMYETYHVPCVVNRPCYQHNTYSLIFFYQLGTFFKKSVCLMTLCSELEPLRANCWRAPSQFQSFFFLFRQTLFLSYPFYLGRSRWS